MAIDVKGRTTIGPDIILDGLSVYYDFSNPKSYPGSGSIVYDLSGNAVNAILSGSGASRPTFTSSLGRSNITFASSNEHFMYYTLPTWGPSFTYISIYASPTTLWDNIGDIGGARWGWEGNTTNDTNGFVHYVVTNPPFAEITGSEASIAFKNGNPGSEGYSTIAFFYPLNIMNPNLYANGYDNSTGDFVRGLNGSVTTGTFGSLVGRGVRNNTRVYFARLDERYVTLTRFTSVKLYMHLLYNRKLSPAEIRSLYDSLQPRFGF